MKEIEILVGVLDSREKALAALKKFTFHGMKTVKDVYFSHPENKRMQATGRSFPKEWLRIRTAEGKHYVAHKVDHFTQKHTWLYSDEFETEIMDVIAMQKILASLGYKRLVEIQNRKHVFLTKKYELVLEEVKDLGLFLEVEQINAKPREDVIRVRADIWKFVRALNINVSPELHVGKPELMLKKQKK
ncbi:MAG: class IV adenylate cyclase [Nanoarchaeota archaeon]